MIIFTSRYPSLSVYLIPGIMIRFENNQYKSKPEQSLTAKEVELRLLAHPNCGKENHFKPVSIKQSIPKSVITSKVIIICPYCGEEMASREYYFKHREKHK